MLVPLNNNRVARVSVQFGNDSPELHKPLPPEAVGKPFRSIKIMLEVYNNIEAAGPPVVDIEGESYCSPLDQFQRRKGRKIAMLRILSAHKQVLAKEDWRKICPVMIHGPAGLKE